MNAINSIVIEGHVAEEAAGRDDAQEDSRCSFLLASHQFIKKGEVREKVTYFFTVEAAAKLEELCMKECVLGRAVRIVGRLSEKRQIEDGKEWSRVVIVADHIEFRPQQDSRKRGS